MKFGNLNFLEPSGLLQAVTGLIYLFFLTFFMNDLKVMLLMQISYLSGLSFLSLKLTFSITQLMFSVNWYEMSLFHEINVSVWCVLENPWILFIGDTFLIFFLISGYSGRGHMKNLTFNFAKHSGNYISIDLTLKTPHFACAVYLCVSYSSYFTVIISLSTSNGLVFVMEAQCVFFFIYCSENLASAYRVTNCSNNKFTTVSLCLFM